MGDFIFQVYFYLLSLKASVLWWWNHKTVAESPATGWKCVTTTKPAYNIYGFSRHTLLFYLAGDYVSEFTVALPDYERMIGSVRTAFTLINFRANDWYAGYHQDPPITTPSVNYVASTIAHAIVNGGGDRGALGDDELSCCVEKLLASYDTACVPQLADNLNGAKRV